jgi:phospholipid/cholesterol/gamma-HCH transport system permease protein
LTRAEKNPVNETLVLCVIALFAVNVVLTTIGVRFGTGS